MALLHYLYSELHKSYAQCFSNGTASQMGHATQAVNKEIKPKGHLLITLKT